MSHPTAPPPAARPLDSERVLSRRNPHLLVVAHRGSWKLAPENSLASIEAAIALGADIVELDVQATSDGALVCVHDDTLDRTTDGVGDIARSAYVTVGAGRLRARGGTSAQPLTELRVPLLAQALEAARNRVLLNLDIKSGDLADQVAQAVISAGMARQVIMKADIRNDADIRWAEGRAFHGHIAFMPKMTAHPGRFAQDLARLAVLRPRMVEVSFGDIADLEAARATLARHDMRLWINTLDVFHSLDFNDTRALTDPDGVWGRLIDAGTGAIQTDESAALVAYLRQRRSL